MVLLIQCCIQYSYSHWEEVTNKNKGYRDFLGSLRAPTSCFGVYESRISAKCSLQECLLGFSYRDGEA